MLEKLTRGCFWDQTHKKRKKLEGPKNIKFEFMFERAESDVKRIDSCCCLR